MKFSIVITTYNRLEFLKRAIASALNQTVPCEVVVVDDASTDDTEAYVRSLGNPVIYHRNATNLNHAGSVNAGVEVSTGDWIKFLDDDDYLAEDCVEKMGQAIAQHPQAVLCSCRSIQVDEHGHELRRTGAVGPGQMFYVPQAAIHYGMLLEQTPIGTPVQVAAQRQAFLKAGGWDITMTTNYDDIDAWVRIAAYGDALFLNDHLAYRTLWSGGFEQRKNFKGRAELNVIIKERIYSHIPAEEAQQSNYPSIDIISQYVYLHWGLVALSQRKLSMASALLFPVCLKLAPWRLLWQIRRTRRHAEQTLVPKLPIA